MSQHQPILGRIEHEIDELVTIGEKLARDAQSSGNHLGPDRVAQLTSISARTGQLIRRVYGADSHYESDLRRVLDSPHFTKMHSNHWHHVAALVGVVKGVQHDIASGLLQDIRALAHAEVFGDFIEMSEHLLDHGYKDAAAVLLGGVLEDALRRIAARKSIATVGPNGRPLTIEPLNVALTKAGTYEALVQKQITSWANLRNDAAHGDHAKYDAVQVKHMFLFVQKFCSDTLS